MSTPELTRRGFVSGILAATTGSAVTESSLSFTRDDNPWSLYWGDLHNHNAVGYAKGSLRRSIDIAQEHLDFFAFTGHASWHDMPKMPGDRHMKWVKGFEVHSNHWPETRRMIREANTDNFVGLLGYEWHSSVFGDYCMIFPEDQPQLYLPDHVDKLLGFAHTQKAFAIPHHLGYKQGWRGANFNHYRATTSPVVEIFSEHGCNETDRSPFPMIRHSMGGRSTSNTVIPQLRTGKRFGFVASSDNHRGYPGAYGEGLMGVWAQDLSAEALFDAIRSRRTYAVSGDRIGLEFTLNGQPMGSDVAATSEREIHVRVEGQDVVSMVELIRNGRVIKRHFPEDSSTPIQLPSSVKCRIQYGWGPWAALNLGRTCHWDMTVQLSEGTFKRVTPCFQSGPYEEDLRDRISITSPREIHLSSFTSRVLCYSEDPTKSIICDIHANPDSTITVKLKDPIEQTVTAHLQDLIDDNLVTFTGEFTSESYILNRIVGPSEYSANIAWNDHNRDAASPDWYYVRVTQHNGHVAWSSPIWVG